EDDRYPHTAQTISNRHRLRDHQWANRRRTWQTHWGHGWAVSPSQEGGLEPPSRQTGRPAICREMSDAAVLTERAQLSSAFDVARCAGAAIVSAAITLP